MKAKKKEIASMGLGELGVDASQVGLAGAKTTVTGQERPQTARAKQVLKAEDGSSAAVAIADFLESRKLI